MFSYEQHWRPSFFAGAVMNTNRLRILLCCALLIFISLIVMLHRHIVSLDTYELKLPPIFAKTSEKRIILSASNTSQSEVKYRVFTNLEIKSNLTKKYILLWTSPETCPFEYLGQGNQVFMKRRCRYTNCYVVPHQPSLKVSRYDVVAFSACELDFLFPPQLPKKRSPHQKYVFTSIESGHNYPLCSDRWDGYFNWTWTFRLDSDARWGYMIVRDSTNCIIGPRKEMHWIKHEDMEPVSDSLKRSLRFKTKAAAWFSSNCNTKSAREKYVEELKVALKKFKLTVDVYGECGNLTCERNFEKTCDKLIEDDYYFYLAFENSFYEDYVTEKVLHGLRHNAVPIVYGGANYTRFMPDGIYIDATQMETEELAEKMYNLMHDMEEYTEFFRWHKHYSFHSMSEVPETDEYCGFCALLNDKDQVAKTTVYNDLKTWWDPPDGSACNVPLPDW